MTSPKYLWFVKTLFFWKGGNICDEYFPASFNWDITGLYSLEVYVRVTSSRGMRSLL